MAKTKKPAPLPLAPPRSSWLRGRRRHGLLRVMPLLAALAWAVSGAPAQMQFVELGRGHLPLEGDCSISVAFGDVDGDGDLDAVVGNTTGSNEMNGPGQPRLYLNDGQGVFKDGTAIRMPSILARARSMALADVDGDGDLDLVLGNLTGWGYLAPHQLYLNNGAGVFTDVTLQQMPSSTSGCHSMAWGDVDGDGDLDLVFGRNQEMLYLNNGLGTFTDATAARMPQDNRDTWAVTLGDVDGDKDLDLVLGNDYGARLYLNDGKGTFTDVTATRMPLTGNNTKVTAVVFGDVDRDGDLDAVIGNEIQSRLFMNDGTGTFTDATAGRMPSSTGYTQAVVLVDVDQDGDLDLICGNAFQPHPLKPLIGTLNRLYLNDGKGWFTDATSTRMPVDVDHTFAVAPGDVDGDGDPDLLLANRFQDRLYLNDGQGRFTSAMAIKMQWVCSATRSPELGDVDRDGDLDIVLPVIGGASVLFLNDGRGRFTDVTAAQMPPGPNNGVSAALGDVDGDGDLDVLYGCDEPIPRKHRLYLNDGKGKFSDVTATHLPPSSGPAGAVALGDVDKDGDLDAVIVYNSNANTQDQLYMNDGTGRFTDGTAARMPLSKGFMAVALRDGDGDGDLDLFLVNYDNSPRFYQNNGKGVFADVTATRLPPSSVSDFLQCVGLGDVDRDGDLDLVFGSGLYNYPHALYLNNGNGVFTEVTATRMPKPGTRVESVKFCDLDADGDLDLVFGSSGPLSIPDVASNTIYMNDGGGTFTDATTSRMPQNVETNRLAVADIDDDGDLDLVGAGNGRQYLFENLLRQIDGPLIARIGYTYRLDLYAKPGFATAPHYALPMLGLAAARIPVPPYGVFGLDPARTITLPIVTLPAPAGMATIQIPIPKDPWLVGAPFFAQALIADGVTTPRLTNVLAETIIKL